MSNRGEHSAIRSRLGARGGGREGGCEGGRGGGHGAGRGGGHGADHGAGRGGTTRVTQPSLDTYFDDDETQGQYSEEVVPDSQENEEDEDSGVI
ncbi:hypothetical protein SOVF_063220 [Spinacia oleracea]|nr:hypothetical protein SOVF_063220 [Spinacia oleracea]